MPCGAEVWSDVMRKTKTIMEVTLNGTPNRTKEAKKNKT
jgi:hypothetical protein